MDRKQTSHKNTSAKSIDQTSLYSYVNKLQHSI